MRSTKKGGRRVESRIGVHVKSAGGGKRLDRLDCLVKERRR